MHVCAQAGVCVCIWFCSLPTFYLGMVMFLPVYQISAMHARTHTIQMAPSVATQRSGRAHTGVIFVVVYFITCSPYRQAGRQAGAHFVRHQLQLPDCGGVPWLFSMSRYCLCVTTRVVVRLGSQQTFCNTFFLYFNAYPHVPRTLNEKQQPLACTATVALTSSSTGGRAQGGLTRAHIYIYCTWPA